MATFDEDLAVDVLVLGSGLQGLYVARALARRYSVAVVADPDAPCETLEGTGHFSAGYEGNDVNRIQPARRAAGYWSLWAESNEVPHAPAPPVAVLDPEDEALTTRLWSDATLVAPATGVLPQVFAGGALAGRPVHELVNDVVLDPTDVLAVLRADLAGRIVAGRVEKFALANEQAVDYVAVEVDGESVPVTPRYIVLASDAANGMLLHRLVARIKGTTTRREASEKVRTCQAVRRKLVVAVRGGDLPVVSGHLADLDVVAHPLPGGEVVWLVSPPIDDAQTVLGPEETRFAPTVDRPQVRHAVERLFELAPGIEDRAPVLRWGAWVARHTQHPSMAVPDASTVAQPAPAKLETLDLERFVAIWPSHLAYAMITGDVVAERIEAALGAPGGEPGAPLPAELVAEPDPELSVARWRRSSFGWTEWGEFAGMHDLKRG